jgi:phenylacetate-CoA ligase
MCRANLRSIVFWLLDSLKGGKVKKHYDEIKFVYEHYNEKEAVEIRKRNLSNILNYAVTHVPFYKPYANYKDISDFPVINKNIVRDHINEFLSPEYDIKTLRKMSTSGSTGTPFTVYQDKNKVLRSAADFIYFYELANYNIGDKMYFLRIWNDINKKSWFDRFSQNIVMQDTGNLSNNNINQFIETLKKDKSKKILHGYAASFTAICQNVSKQDTKEIVIQSIVSGSEALPESTKKSLKQLFNCPVYSKYSNQENGLIAQQCDDDSGEYHINVASYLVEILSLDTDKPVKSGEKGRVVITDLFNYSMPLIRYDTGDIAVYGEEASCLVKNSVLRSIEGRRLDFIFNTKGEMLSPSSISTAMWKFSGILQFQFIQESEKNYTIKLNCRENFTQEELLIKDFQKYLDEDAVITIEYVSEIPLLKSGKRKYVVNNYKKGLDTDE